MEKIIPGTEGGKHIAGAPLTTEATLKASPELLRNTVDERIVRVRPMSTPLDQISRCAGARHCNSMTVEYYMVDTKAVSTVVSKPVAKDEATNLGEGVYIYSLKVENPKVLDVSETILFPELTVIGGPNSGQKVVAYIHNITDGGDIEIIPVNANANPDNGEITMPDIKETSLVVRMGRAATELDVMTPQFNALPAKMRNNCQIFKMQVEQSTLQKIADKEVGWTFSDQEEAAVIDMRLGMEKNYLFGHSAKILDCKKNEYVYLTGGIWNQTSKRFDVNVNTLNEAHLVELCSKAFTQNNGSKRKILIGGTGLIEAINKINPHRIVVGQNSFVKWGLEFREIVSNFGKLYVLHSEIFDECGHANDGMVIDPDYITKYTHIPFNIEKLDLRTSGIRNTDAVVLTEASCLVLRYPSAHMRIIGN